MKNVKWLLASLLLVSVSCSKDHTCTCSTTLSGSTTVTETTLHGKKKEAQAACEEGSASKNGATTTCKIN